ncbi:MAG TPA: DJ-1/PfpI family protein [Vicinamibacteria bacterium]|nr:DJ-1/PfpI family protein [Candidatus Sulfotelmatobacter sp.]HXK11438.1 DJ-1/PfpI family protein [Vicinamibacteria bacterium]
MRRRGLLRLWGAAGLSAFATRAASGGDDGAAEPAEFLSPAPSGRIPVAFVLAEDAEVVDFAGPWGVFEYVDLPGQDGTPFQLFTVAETRRPLKVSGGLTVVPNHTFASAPQPRIIVVPAQGEPSAGLLSWLKRSSLGAELTMSVCNGAFVLAKAGLLSGKTATAHHAAYTLLSADFPDIKVKRGARFVDAGTVSTAGGLTSGIDLALHVVERYYGRAAAERTATALEYQGAGWKDPDSNAAFAARPVSTDARPLCPVCEMEVDKRNAPSETYRGRTYYFCSIADKKRFHATPDRFTEP